MQDQESAPAPIEPRQPAICASCGNAYYGLMCPGALCGPVTPRSTAIKSVDPSHNVLTDDLAGLSRWDQPNGGLSGLVVDEG